MSHGLQVLMPWRYSTGYVLFVINHANKFVSVFNFTPTPEWCKDIPLNRFWEAIVGTLNQGYPLLQYEGAAPVRHLQATRRAAPDPTTWVGLGPPRGKER
jgi:hypothetical protein